MWAMPMPVFPAVPSTTVPPGRQRTIGFGGANDPQRRAIFDGAAGIQEFGFAEDLAARFVGECCEANQRRIADGIDEAVRMSMRS